MPAYITPKLLTEAGAIAGMALWSARDALTNPITDPSAAARAAAHLDALADDLSRHDHGALGAAMLRGMAHAIRTDHGL